MKVYGFQINPAWEDKEENFKKIAKLASSVEILPKSLLVMPECFATGFSLNTDVTSLDEPQKSLQFLKNIALKYDSWVIAGIIEKLNGDSFNRALCVEPNGQVLPTYDKIHPISLLQENTVHKPGIEIQTWPLGPFHACPFICYDLRFPEVFRAAMVKDVNLFIVIACWPTARMKHWKTLIQARAIENLSYVIGINRTGNDPDHEFSGNSMVVGPQGNILAESGDQETVLEAEILLDDVFTWRKQFPALNDISTKFLH
jgi:omega-amidase